jgi:polyisoprenyl-phosphate glycosyltransferase
VAALGVALSAYTLLVFLLGRHVPDWTALPIMLLVLAGAIIVTGGVTGLYVGKIFEQVKGRPLYVVDTRLVDGVERAVPRALAEAGDPPTRPLAESEPVSSPRSD